MTAPMESPGFRQPGPPTAACRRFLEAAFAALPAADNRQSSDSHDALDGHASGCSYCAARLAAGRRIAGALRAPVAASPSLRTPDAFAKLCERITTAAESGPLGQFLTKSLPVASPRALAATVPAAQLESNLAAVAATTPPLPSAHQWAQVSLQLRSHRWRLERRRRFAGMALAGAAAAAIMGAFFISDGTRSEPSIVIADAVPLPTASAPGDLSLFAIVRHGR